MALSAATKAEMAKSINLKKAIQVSEVQVALLTHNINTLQATSKIITRTITHVVV